MANRELTYYSIGNRETISKIHQFADNCLDDSFHLYNIDGRWDFHLYTEANNEAFLDEVSTITDLEKLKGYLRYQLKQYIKAVANEYFKRNKGVILFTEKQDFEARKIWLKQTSFICKNQFNETRKEIFNEAVIWCNEYLDYYLETEESNTLNNSLEQILPLLNNEGETQTEPNQTKNNSFEYKNNFDKVDEKIVYKFFHSELVDNGYLSEENLKLYLKAAFENEKAPQTLFKLNDKNQKKKILTIFYTYYVEIANNPFGEAPKFAALLGNYFEKYKTENVRTNWNRDYTKKK